MPAVAVEVVCYKRVGCKPQGLTELGHRLFRLRPSSPTNIANVY